MISAAENPLPVLVRDGAILPLMEPLLHAPEPDDRPALALRCHGAAGGRTRLYLDDGLTFDHEQGRYQWVEIHTSTTEAGEATRTISSPEELAGWFGAIRWTRLPAE